MRKLLFLLIAVLSLIISGCATVSQPERAPANQFQRRYWSVAVISEVQPISVGNIIFSSSLGAVDGLWWEVVYKYLGGDEKTIKVSRTYTIPPHPPQSVLLQLPLSQKKQALLEVDAREADPSGGWIKRYTKELLITVIDEFGRITVEEVAKQQKR